MRKYAGIGSRKTPPEICALMTRFAKIFGSHGWLLRSGGAEGADIAFEKGARAVGGKIEIWVPYVGFNSNPSNLTPTMDAFELAERCHPYWNACNPSARKMHARNCHQVLGRDLDDPVECIICYAPGGLTGGGTSQALRVANDLQWRKKIQVYNLCDSTVLKGITNFVEQSEHGAAEVDQIVASMHKERVK